MCWYVAQMDVFVCDVEHLGEGTHVFICCMDQLGGVCMLPRWLRVFAICTTCMRVICLCVAQMNVVGAASESGRHSLAEGWYQSLADSWGVWREN